MSQTQVGFQNTFRSEWLKLVTLRSVRRNLALGIIFGLIISLGVAFVSGLTWDSWDETGREEFDPMLYPLTGGILTVIFFAAVGVNAMASEYSSGMIRLTLMATPRRQRVLLAKALAVAILTTLAGIVVTAGMLFGSQPIYSHYGLPTADLWNSDFTRLCLLGTVTTCVFPVLAMCLTTFTRTTASALVVVILAMFAPMTLGGILPQWWQEHILILLPGVASDAIAAGHLSSSDEYLSPWVASLITIGWLTAALVGAVAVFNRRDA